MRRGETDPAGPKSSSSFSVFFCFPLREREQNFESRRGLGYDIRDQLILERGDLVLELELALLEPRDLKLVVGGREDQSIDRIVEVAMLLPQDPDQPNDFRFVHQPTHPANPNPLGV